MWSRSERKAREVAHTQREIGGEPACLDCDWQADSRPGNDRDAGIACLVGGEPACLDCDWQTDSRLGNDRDAGIACLVAWEA